MGNLTFELPSPEGLREANLRRWAEVLTDPKLAKLSARVETDRYGHLVLSPLFSARCEVFQFRAAARLGKLLSAGRVVTDCPVSTADGVKIADVAWASPGRVQELGAAACFPQAPEICVKLTPPHLSAEEIQEKTALFFDAGAREVWLCSEHGELTFYRAGEAAPQSNSEVCPAYPAHIEW